MSISDIRHDMYRDILMIFSCESMKISLHINENIRLLFLCYHFYLHLYDILCLELLIHHRILVHTVTGKVFLT